MSEHEVHDRNGNLVGWVFEQGDTWGLRTTRPGDTGVTMARQQTRAGAEVYLREHVRRLAWGGTTGASQ